MLRYEMPVVYHLLRHLCAGQQPFEPDWRVVESVARASKDPSYRKPKFRRYLEEYSREGLYCRRGKRLTPPPQAGCLHPGKPHTAREEARGAATRREIAAGNETYR